MKNAADSQSTVEFVATFTLSAQVTEDSHRVMQHHLKCGPETTLADIFKWKDSLGKGVTSIHMTIDRLEALP